MQFQRREELPTPPGVAAAFAQRPQSQPSAGFSSRGGDGTQPSERRLIGGLLAPLLTGTLISALVIAEGIAVLVVAASDSLGPRGSEPGSPLQKAHALFLDVLGTADIAAAILGLIGLGLASLRAPPAAAALRAVPPWLVPRLADAVPGGAAGGVGALLAWRAVAAAAIAPWAGFIIVFSPPEYQKVWHCIAALIYTCFAFYLVVLLFSVMRAAVDGANAVREELLLQVAENSAQKLLGSPADEGAAEESILGCVPLDYGVLAYAICVGIMSLWLMAGLVVAGKSGGGWAFLSEVGQQNVATRAVEAFVYTVSACTAALAASAIIARRRADRGVADDSTTMRKRCAGLLLVFLTASALRFSLSVPVTGLALAGEDLCGMYMYGLAVVSLDDKRLSPASAAAVHCTADEVRVIVVLCGVMFLDGYFIYGTLKLWAKYRSSCTTSATQSSEGEDFGARRDSMSVAATGTVLRADRSVKLFREEA